MARFLLSVSTLPLFIAENLLGIFTSIHLCVGHSHNLIPQGFQIPCLSGITTVLFALSFPFIIRPRYKKSLGIPRGKAHFLLLVMDEIPLFSALFRGGGKSPHLSFKWGKKSPEVGEKVPRGGGKSPHRLLYNSNRLFQTITDLQSAPRV